MNDLMQYKDYFGSVRYDDDDRVFHGKVEFIRALVSYEGMDVESLRKAFEEAVDDYLELCRKQKREPEKPFKGSLNVRIGPRLHQEIALTALNEGMSLNQYIAWVLEKDSRERQAFQASAEIKVSEKRMAYGAGATMKFATVKITKKTTGSSSERSSKADRTVRKPGRKPATQ